MTAKGLFNTIYLNCDSLFVMDDNIDIKDKKIRKLLLPMLEKPKNKNSNVREIRWINNREEKVAKFRGGIIIINNYPLTNDRHGQAIASRVEVIHFQLTHKQIVEKVGSIIKNGYMGIPYATLVPHFNFYAKCHKGAGQPFDLRRFFDKIVPHIVAHKRNIVETSTSDFIKGMFGII